MDEVFSDYHNFGQSVTRHGKWFLKPRPTVWEHFFLDPRSGLRERLCDFEIFSFLPDLHVDLEDGFFSSARMEAFTASAEFALTDARMWRSLGAFQGLASYFGMGDLHFENVLLGVHQGQFKIAPIDLECALNLRNEPWESLLLPSHITSKEKCGYSAVFASHSSWDFETALLSMLQGYFDSLMHLDEITDDINNIFSELMKHKIPICRVPLRATSFYERIRDDSIKKHDMNLLPSELGQLERGDIPYYFRYPDDDRIFYFQDRESLKLAEDSPILETIKAKFGFWNQEHGRFEPILTERSLLQGAMVMARTLHLLQGRDARGLFEHGHLKVVFEDSQLKLGYGKMHGSSSI